MEAGSPSGEVFWLSGLRAWIQSSPQVTATEQHPKEPFGLALHANSVSSPPFIIGIESERGRKDPGGGGESDFSSLSGSKCRLDRRGNILGQGRTLDRKQRWQRRLSFHNLCLRGIGAIGFHAFTPPSQPITLSDWGPMEPGEPSTDI